IPQPLAELHFQPLDTIKCQGFLELADACWIIVIVKDHNLREVSDICKTRHINAAEQIPGPRLIEFSRPTASQWHQHFALHADQLPALHEFLLSAVYLRVAGANNSIVRDARVFLASPWRRRRLTMGAYSMDLRERVA